LFLPYIKGAPVLTVKALKGFKDILPDEARTWQWIEETARNIFHRFGFAEIKVPILEKTELFQRSIGEATDIVEKEMYTFIDRNGVSLTMRPEGTASVLRAFIEHSLHMRPAGQRLYTIGPMFRHERPQKGRLRQFHQLSVEALGCERPELDVEVMAMAALLLQELGLNVSLQINSLGCAKCRPAFNRALVDFLSSQEGGLCEDCERRRHTNPLRVLDCKSVHCKEKYTSAPAITDHLCKDCVDHFRVVEQGLIALDIPYQVNPLMVRGLDYYTRTTFELITDALGSQSAVGAGGRYDGLLGQLGGPDLPGIGFGMGVERLVLLLQQLEAQSASRTIDLFLIALGNDAFAKGFKLVHTLRAAGLQVLMDIEGRSLKSQMKQANKANARFALIIGENELQKGEGVIKNMTTGEQSTIPLPENGNDEWHISLIEKLKTKYSH
jgi:histidyl-tRNA synthetase